MPKLRTALIAGGASLLFAGAAFAAAEKLNTMSVALPDGSVAHITYVGDTAPRVAIDPVDSRQAIAYDPFVQMERDMAAMQQRSAQLMQRTAEMQRSADTQHPEQIVVSGNLPAGNTYSYTSITSSNGKNFCTQTVQWSSDGKNAEPKITRASSGDCDSAKIKTPVPAAAAPGEAHVKPDPRSI